jgi:hypothetical protein
MLSEVVIWIEQKLIELKQDQQAAQADNNVRAHIAARAKQTTLEQLLGLIRDGAFD